MIKISSRELPRSCTRTLELRRAKAILSFREQTVLKRILASYLQWTEYCKLPDFWLPCLPHQTHWHRSQSSRVPRCFCLSFTVFVSITDKSVGIYRKSGGGHRVLEERYMGNVRVVSLTFARVDFLNYQWVHGRVNLHVWGLYFLLTHLCSAIYIYAMSKHNGANKPIIAEI